MIIYLWLLLLFQTLLQNEQRTPHLKRHCGGLRHPAPATKKVKKCIVLPKVALLASRGDGDESFGSAVSADRLVIPPEIREGTHGGIHRVTEWINSRPQLEAGADT